MAGYQLSRPNAVAAVEVDEEIWFGSKDLRTSTFEPVNSTKAVWLSAKAKLARPMKSRFFCGCWMIAAAG